MPAAQRFAEAHHLLGAVENLDAAARAHLRDDEVERVRPDVERGDSHGLAKLLVGRPGASVHAPVT